jgi:trehalose utilization protein
VLNVTIWNEFRHEKKREEVKALYPGGIHKFIAGFLKCDDITITLAALDDKEQGLSDEVLGKTDVLIWWGHGYHELVADSLVDKLQDRILRGMGLVALHSAHHSKIFKRMMGTSCNLKWRDGARERIWCINPAHPIAKGVDEYFELEKEEMYGEFFDIPQPDELVFAGWFNSGELFRSGCAFYRGRGKIFYFQPGHESNKSFYNKNVQTIIRNAVYWTAPNAIAEKLECPKFEPLERI